MTYEAFLMQIKTISVHRHVVFLGFLSELNILFGGKVSVEVVDRIDALIVAENFVVEVRSLGKAGIARVADDLPSFDALAFLDDDLRHVGVLSYVAVVSMSNFDLLAISSPANLGEFDDAITGCIDGCTSGSLHI